MSLRLQYSDSVDIKTIKYDLRIYDHIYNSVHANSFIDYIKNEEILKDQDRWREYNIFTFDHPFIDDLRKDVWKIYTLTCLEYGFDPDETVMINGFVNYLTSGDRVKKHYHAKYGDVLFTCVKTLKCSDDSRTTFHLPIENGDKDLLDIRNYNNQTIIFPQWLPHSVICREEERITIGIDIIDRNQANNYVDIAVPIFKEQ